jgi:hypothetical protein
MAFEESHSWYTLLTEVFEVLDKVVDAGVDPAIR